MKMGKKTCTYVLLSLCISGLVLGIVLVLVFIKLLVVPLQGKHRPLTQQCMVIDISPVSLTTKHEPVNKQDLELKVQKLSDLENEVLSKAAVKHDERRHRGKLSDSDDVSLTLSKSHYISDDGHRTRHRHVITSDDAHNSDIVICYIVRVQFYINVLEHMAGAPPVVREGFLKQSRDGILANDDSKEVEGAKCFCKDCLDENSTNSSRLIYASGHVTEGDNVLCSYVETTIITSKKKKMNWLLLNAMFWPTLIFILGFVGLFFVGIRIALNNSSKRTKSINSRTPLK